MLQFIKSIPQTFYSQPFYVNLIRRGKGIGVGFIFLQAVLTLLMVLVSFLSSQTSFAATQKSVEVFFDSFPAVTIKEQKLSIDRPSPYVIDLPIDNKEHLSVVFDTAPRDRDEAKIAEEMKTKKMLALVTSDFLAVPNQSSIKFFSFTDFTEDHKKSLTVSRDDWTYIGKNLLKWGIPSFSLLLLIRSFIASLLATFLIALFVKLCAFLLTIRPNLPAAMRLCAAATIPGGVLGVILVPFHISLSIYVSLFIILAFAFFGLVCANMEVVE